MPNIVTFLNYLRNNMMILSKRSRKNKKMRENPEKKLKIDNRIKQKTRYNLNK